MADEFPESDPQRPAKPDPPPTPFDHPLFLPALLVAGVLWFGYDGWINTDPEMLEHQDFNRYGFGVLLVLGAWFGYRGWGEWQEDRAKARAKKEESPEGL
ncbi:MAG: tetratricopeptide repeat protein [Myxococcota bacterium]|nr:tetratricopeptide repeat protein [Myxococcota bacterium]